MYYAVAVGAVRMSEEDGAHAALQVAIIHDPADLETAALETALNVFPLADGWEGHIASTLRIAEAVIEIERAEANRDQASLNIVFLQGQLPS